MYRTSRSLTYNRWVIFIVAMLVTLVNLSFVFSLGAIFVDLLEKFKINRPVIALVQSLLIFMTVFGVVTGILISKYGLRKISLIGSVFASVGMGMSYFATSVWHLYITISTITGIGITMMYMCSTVSIGYAFHGRAKLNALAVQFSCIGIGAAVYPYLLRYLTSTYGINGSFLILSGVFLNNFAAAILFPGLSGKNLSEKDKLMKESIEKSNTTDNDNLNPNSPMLKRFTTYIKNELSSIMSTPYIMTLVATALGQSLTDGFTVVYIDIYVWKHFTNDQATGSMIVYQISSIIVRLLAGVLMQSKRINSLVIPIVCSLCGCFGVVTIYLSMRYAIAYIGSGLIGMSAGGFIGGSGIVVAEIVPKERFGVAYGLMFSSIAVLSIGTAPFFGAIRDSAQSYLPVFVLLGVSYFMAAILYLIAFVVRRLPKRKENNYGSETKHNEDNEDETLFS